MAHPPGRRRGVGLADVPRERPSPSSPTWPASASSFSSSSSANIGPNRSDPAWCNRPSSERNPERPAATAAQSDSKQVPSMNPT